MNLLARSVMYLYIWKQYGNQLKRLGFFIITISSIQMIHNEYLGYCSASNSTDWLGYSFVVKWILFGLTSFIVARLHLKVKKEKDLPQGLDHKFDNIRKLKKLKSRGDNILDI